MIPLDDMQVFVVEQPPPAKLVKALAVIAANLHPLFAVEGLASKTQCILCALAVRDFLQDIGFRDARVLSVAVILKVIRNDRQLHSLGIGVPDNPQKIPNKWNGHLVTVLPKSRWLIDTTLYQAQRPQWDELAGMVAAPMLSTALRKPMHMIAGLMIEDGQRRVSGAWFSRPSNGGWINAPDTINARRAPVVAGLASAFGGWRDG